ncbi:MAG: TraK family protein [Proteobacteria bacterium]|nr:TraK family protein [Pseudomonadota bacterium]MBU1584041.1 TraK family protein [Pseudomonadota bacterium]MBU2629301.1 TraK family protein [Pseudomonadota bacterium]
MSLLKKLHKIQPGLKGVIKSYLKDIKQGLDEGYTKKNIYKLLEKEGSINCQYSHFIRTLNILLNENNNFKKPSSGSILKKKSFIMQEIDDADLK